MINPFKIGDIKEYQKVVGEEDIARFESGEVHAFYSTFALGRDAEWAGRLFVLEMKEEGEEGIGTFLTINHHSPAFVNDTVTIKARLDLVEKNKVNCSFEANVGDRLIATGTTGQKIVSKEKLTLKVKALRNGGE